MNDQSRRRRRVFPPDPTPTLAGRRELNKGQPEVCGLCARVAIAEQVEFPGVAQVALWRRHLRQHAPELVALVTSRPPAELHAAQWLAAAPAA